MKKSTQATERTVRIIRATNNYKLDYFIPASRAKELFEQGKLCQIVCTSHGWDYATNSPAEAPR